MLSRYNQSVDAFCKSVKSFSRMAFENIKFGKKVPGQADEISPLCASGLMIRHLGGAAFAHRTLQLFAGSLS